MSLRRPGSEYFVPRNRADELREASLPSHGVGHGDLHMRQNPPQQLQYHVSDTSHGGLMQHAGSHSISSPRRFPPVGDVSHMYAAAKPSPPSLQRAVHRAPLGFGPAGEHSMDRYPAPVVDDRGFAWSRQHAEQWGRTPEQQGHASYVVDGNWREGSRALQRPGGKETRCNDLNARFLPPYDSENSFGGGNMERTLYNNALRLRQEFDEVQLGRDLALSIRGDSRLALDEFVDMQRQKPSHGGPFPSQPNQLAPSVPADVTTEQPPRGMPDCLDEEFRSSDLSVVLRAAVQPDVSYSLHGASNAASSDSEAGGATTTSSPLTAESVSGCDTTQDRGKRPMEAPDDAEPDFGLGQVVDVLPRTWAGMNKPGGTGRITKIGMNVDGRKVVNVKYILSSTEDKEIDLEFIAPKIINDQANVGRVKRSRSGRQIQPVVHNLPEDDRRSGYQKSSKKTRGKQSAQEEGSNNAGCENASQADPQSTGAMSRTLAGHEKVDHKRFEVVAGRQWSALERMVERLSRLDAYAFWQNKPPVPLSPARKSRRGKIDPLLPDCFATLRRHVLNREYSIKKCQKNREDLRRSLAQIVGGSRVQGDGSKESAASPEDATYSKAVTDSAGDAKAVGSLEEAVPSPAIETSATSEAYKRTLEDDGVRPLHEQSYLESLFEDSDLQLVELCISWPHLEMAFSAIFKQTLAAFESDDSAENVDEDEQDTVVGEAKKLLNKGGKIIRGAAEKAHAELIGLLDESRTISLERVNSECVFPSRWRRKAFPLREYHKIDDYVPTSALEDKERDRIEALRKTELSGFCGGAYNFDDHELQEEWMTGYNDTYAPVPDDDAVRRLCVSDFLDTLCNRVVDRVLNAEGCLDKPVLEVASGNSLDCGSKSPQHGCQLVEKPVWGIDSFTRRNIELSLMPPGQVEHRKYQGFASPRKSLRDVKDLPSSPNGTQIVASFGGTPTGQSSTPQGALPAGKDGSAQSAVDGNNSSTGPSLSVAEREYFVEFVLLPAINCQPADIASDVRHALRFIINNSEEGLVQPRKFRAAARQLLRVVEKMGIDHFKVHPKGTGVVVTNPKGLKPHTLVNFYLGETFTSWRWGEKADGIAAAQVTLGMRPQLPDFYNILLERPKNDPKGWGLIYVDASSKANMSSSLSHSCSANCNTFIVGKDGRVSIALCTTREVKYGEELTMDYNSVTSDESEWYSAICLCGTPRCRGSFLHFAAHDSYMQIVNNKYGPCYRFASLLRQSRTAKAGYPEKVEDAAILNRHGFGEAALGPEAGLGLETPSWLRRFIADTLRYIEFERRTLPIQLMKATNPCRTSQSADGGVENGGRSKAKKTSDMAFGAISDVLAHSEKQLCEEVSACAHRYTMESADGEARQMMEQRAQSLMSALSRARRVLALVAAAKGADFVASEVPLRLLTSQEAIEHLWAGPRSVAALSLSVLVEAVTVFEGEHLKETASAEPSSPKKRGVSNIVKPAMAKKAVAATVRHFIRRLEALYRVQADRPSTSDSGYAMDGLQNPDLDFFNEGLEWARPEQEKELATSPVRVTSLQTAKTALLAFRGELRALVTEISSLEKRAVEGVRRLGGSATSCANAKKSVSSALAGFRSILSPLALCDAILLAANTETFVMMNAYPIVKAQPIPIRVRDLGGENLPARVVHQLKGFQYHQENLNRRIRSTRSSPQASGTASRTPEESGSEAGAEEHVAPPSRNLNPEMVVIEHAHVYQSDFIFSQLMQWYNYGEGTRTPHLNGCVLNPNPTALLMKPSAPKSGDQKSGAKDCCQATRPYSNALRYSLLKCLLNEQSRTMPFPEDVSKAFGFPTVAYTEKFGFPSNTVFGSPVLDLVLSDSSGLNEVTDVLKAELKVDDMDIKEEIRSGELRMENSIPVQPATWVQCEDPKCMKWRKLPWWIEPDNLPDKWYCSMNEWCPELASCQAEEQKWDPAEEATVSWATGDLDRTALDAKRSLTIAHDDDANLAVAQLPNPEEKFEVNGKLDVYCKRNKCWYEATVVKIVSHDETQKKRVDAKIRVHFKGWNKNKDEWIFMSGPKAEVGRVAPFRSRTYEYVDKHWSTCIHESIRQAGGSNAHAKAKVNVKGKKRKSSEKHQQRKKKG